MVRVPAMPLLLEASARVWSWETLLAPTWCCFLKVAIFDSVDDILSQLKSNLNDKTLIIYVGSLTLMFLSTTIIVQMWSSYVLAIPVLSSDLQ